MFGLGISIFLQSIERFISLQSLSCLNVSYCCDANPQIEVENPKLVLIIGGVGLGLNIISVLFLHGE